jgi:predicted amidophosphoribosyltransferase
VDESYEFEIKPPLESARLFIENLNQTKEKLMNDELICSECKDPFRGSDEGVSPIRHCPKCAEVMQERMLTAIFGEIKR